MPVWLNHLAVFSLIAAGICAAIIAVDVARHPQNMWIMSVVWPVTALWSGPFGLYAYYKVGRLSTKERVRQVKERGEDPSHQKKPFWQSVAIGATHCGSGCTLADICVEWFAFFVPLALFGSHVFGTWALDYIVAFSIGVAFQYFTIKPMRDLSVGKGIEEAVKADTLSLTAWQIGMYGWMAIALFVLFTPETLRPNTPVFWLMMQIGMALGFFTSYPVNWWLLSKHIKEVM